MVSNSVAMRAFPSVETSDVHLVEMMGVPLAAEWALQMVELTVWNLAAHLESQMVWRKVEKKAVPKVGRSVDSTVYLMVAHLDERSAVSSAPSKAVPTGAKMVDWSDATRAVWTAASWAERSVDSMVYLMVAHLDGHSAVSSAPSKAVPTGAMMADWSGAMRAVWWVSSSAECLAVWMDRWMVVHWD